MRAGTPPLARRIRLGPYPVRVAAGPDCPGGGHLDEGAGLYDQQRLLERGFEFDCGHDLAAEGSQQIPGEGAQPPSPAV